MRSESLRTESTHIVEQLEGGDLPSRRLIGVSLLSVKQDMIGGLASYVRQVARALAEHDPDSYVFFVPDRLADYWSTLLPEVARIHPLKVENGSANIRSLYEILRLPGTAKELGCAVLFYPNTTVPIFSDPVPVVTIHDVMYLSQRHDTPWHKKLYLDWCYATIRAKQARVVTISQFSRSDISRRTRIDANQIRSIYSGVDETFLAAGPGEMVLNELPDDPYVLSVGAAYPHKRLPVLVEAFEHLAIEDPRLHLVMAGTGHGSDGERQRLAARIAQSPARGRIVRLGHVPWTALPMIYRRAEVLVHGSSFEGFGFPIAEAMASGTPVAAAPADAVVELLNGNGDIAEGWEGADLAAAIRRVLAWDTQVRQRNTSAAKQIALDKFRWANVASELQQVFSEALRNHGQ